MKYRDIEIEWMRELLRENKQEIFRLRKENRNLRQENERLRRRLLILIIYRWNNLLKKIKKQEKNYY